MIKSRASFTIACLALISTFLVAGSTTARRSSASSRPVCLDLTKYYNATLTTSLNSPDYVKENNLATLPAGRQVFSGIPFMVEGVVQLSGKKVREWGRNEFPEAVTGIRVNRKFSKLCLLHGAGGVYDEDGVTIGKLVLHYANDSTQEIEIKNGVNVRDWWGNPDQPITGTNSALAWTGSNPALKQYGGNTPGKLRLYTTMFPNPQPDVVVKSIDYCSTMQNSSPFLIALTVE